jgi:iron complex transport system permease protein
MNRNIFFISLCVLLILDIWFCLIVGSHRVTLNDFSHTLFHPRESGTLQTIIWSIRVPRVLAGLLIGAGLAVTGCVFQGILRNPLAEPYTLGVSGGAALGVTVAIVTGMCFSWLTIPIFSFSGALLAVGLVYLLASRLHFSVTGLILGGVVLSFIFSSLVLFIFALAKPVEVQTVFMWLMGNLSAIDTLILKVVAIVILAGICVIFILGRDLDALTLGDEKALHLGINVLQIRRFLYITSSLIVGACVSLTGIIGFVGLIIPHLNRLIIGPNHRPLILASALVGGIFLSLADTLARTIIAPVELPVGVITGIIGGGFFIILLLIRSRKESLL